MSLPEGHSPDAPVVPALTAKGCVPARFRRSPPASAATSLQLITAAEARGQQHLAEMNPQVPHDLADIITALNDPGPGKARHAG